MDFVLFDPPVLRDQLLPFTFLRPCPEIRIGILRIREKWETFLNGKASWFTQPYLADRFPYRASELAINGCLLPTPELVTSIQSLPEGSAMVYADQLLAFRTQDPASILQAQDFSRLKQIPVESANLISHPWDIFSENGAEIKADLALIRPKKAKVEDPYTRVYGSDNLYVAPGAQVKAAIINAEHGPVYLGPGSVVQEGSVLYGPLAVCENAQINTGAKIRANTTIGPYSKVGGEVNNAVIFGYSNKAHDGFLGNSVIGEWCNLGADTNNSNLKNNYEEVKVWSYPNKRFIKTGKQFCGLFMGDHSKCSINTMFNTGTSVGIGANIFGAGFHANFIPSFSWGGPQGRTTFKLDRMIETAELVMKRRGMVMEEADKKILQYVFEQTAPFRSWEKVS